jgi:integrase
MNEVQPIRNKRDIAKIKKALHGRDRLLFVLGVSLGLRIGDLLSLKVGDLRNKTHLTLLEEKTKKRQKRRRITLSKTVIAEVSALEGDDNDFVFKSRKGNGPITRVQAYRILNDAAERAGVNITIGTHSLRKTFGYQLHAQGIDITRVMEIFGHSTPGVTLRYIGITSEEIDAAYEAIEV